MVIERDLLDLLHQLLLLGLVTGLLQLAKKLVNLGVTVMTIVAGAIGAHNRRQVGVGIARGKRGVSHGANVPVAVGQTNGDLFGYLNISSDADLGKL